MRKLFIVGLAILVLFSFGTIAAAKTLKLGLDAGPVSQDPQVQLSGGSNYPGECCNIRTGLLTRSSATPRI
jgi:hypothetical protein